MLRSLIPVLETLPTFVSVETIPVLIGQKRGASIQITDEYFENSITVLNTLEREMLANRIEVLRNSQTILNDVEVSIDAVEVSALQSAAKELRETYREMPEISQLRVNYPGDCIVAPEFLRTEKGHIQFGLRLYFFREDAAPDPFEIIRQNVTAVVDETRQEFERYKGQLHGYPDCCISHFRDRPQNAPPPEFRSVKSLSSAIHDELIGQSSVSIQEILPEYFTNPYAYAFFARKFYPEPQCGIAQSQGRNIYEALTEYLPKTLVRDYFRLNYALCYTLAQTLSSGDGKLPSVGALGSEHVYFYLPLKGALTISRYNSE